MRFLINRLLVTERQFPLALIRKGLISMPIYSIYKITNKTNGKIYIGFTSSFIKRKSKHLAKARRNVNRPLYNAINKYGVDQFEWDIIYQSKDRDHTLKEMEPHFIIEYQSNIKTYGYNMTKGGEGSVGVKLSPETRQKMANAHKGHKVSEETRQKISKAKIGRKHTMETKLKMSINGKGKIPWNKGLTYNRTRGYYDWIITKPNGEVITVSNLKQFCKESGCDYVAMVNKGKSKKHLCRKA